MKLLTCAFYYYYGDSRYGIEPQFYSLYRAPESLGYTVDFFDYGTAAKIGVEQMRRVFSSIVKSGKYDAVFIATYGDEFDEETLAEAKKFSPIIAWNSDDERRWEDYSRERVSWYTYMVTNSPEIHKNNKGSFPNLLHAQWACTGFWDGRNTKKDIDFSFVGQVYGPRREQIGWLSKHANLQAFGKGTGNNIYFLRRNDSFRSVIKNRLWRFPLKHIANRMGDVSAINYEQVNMLWNRSRISFTPLDSSKGNVRQIKGRIFDMGQSGTLMLTHQAPYLDTYYEPDKEFVLFEDLQDCVDKAKFYLKNETARKKIAEAYAKRTLSEHLWRHRIERVLKEAGILK